MKFKNKLYIPFSFLFFRLIITGINTTAIGKLKYSKREWQMTELKIDLDIDAMWANFNGMDFINEFLTDAGPILMADLWPYIEPSVVDQVKEVINI